MAGVMPAQLSASQVPVANAQINVLFGMALVTGWTVPVTAERCRPVLKSALSVMSLYAAKVTAPATGHDPVHAGVVTDTAALGVEEPAPSFASTEKLNVLCAASPFTVKLVLLAVPMGLPFFNTV